MVREAASSKRSTCQWPAARTNMTGARSEHSVPMHKAPSFTLRRDLLLQWQAACVVHCSNAWLHVCNCITEES